MIYITESTIDHTIEKFENQQYYFQKLDEILNEQKDLISLISAENQSLLSKEELSLLEYLTLIIYFSSKEGAKNLANIKGKDLEEAEENNWETFNSVSGSFSKVLDKYFDAYPQEDLLSLVEDTLQPDEDQIITNVGREIVFVVCKSIIDVLHQSN